MSAKNTCILPRNYIEYYYSCPSSNYPIAGKWIGNNIAAAFQIGKGGRGANIPIFFLRNFFENYGYSKYLLKPEIILLDKVSNQEPNFTNKHHPNVYQGLWITNKINPEKIDSNLSNFIEQTKKIPSFEVILWTNISPQKLKELNLELEINNIKVKNIADLKTNYRELIDFIITPEKYIASNKGKLYNGIIIDAAKYLIAESEGGFIADLNFKLSDGFSLDEITKYDFIAPNKGLTSIENGFFYTKPHHIIFQDILNIISELLLSPDCSISEFREIMNKGSHSDGITYSFSMSPLAISYIKNNNKKGNIDVLTSPRCLKDNSIEELESEISAHSKNYDKLFSKDIKLFEQFIGSYVSLLGELQGKDNFDCIKSDLVGVDNNLSMTWWKAEIIS